tara:strand:+ start:390 stop:566 length:177 start_codon:yes stop_codon:yes gene_type:complete
MRKLRTFKCGECDHIKDRFIEDGILEVDCEKCGSKAELQLSAPKYFGNSTGRSPSAVS